MAEIASLVVNVAGNITGAVNSFKSLEQTSRSTAKKIESNFSNLKNIGTGLFGTAVLKSIVDTGIQFQSIRQSIEAVTGSAEKMNDVMNFISSNSERTGVNILKASKDFRMLLGASQGAGYAMSDIKNMFSAVSDASLVLGMRADDVTGIMRAFGQIMSKGTVQAEELKGQIGDRLVGALGLASDAMGVTNAQLLKMMETGTLVSKDFLPKFAQQIENTYGKMVPNMQKTALYSINQMDNAFLKLKDSIARSGLLDIVTQLTQSLTQAINNIDKQTMQDISEIFNALSVVAKILTESIKEIISYFRSFDVTLGKLVFGLVAYKGVTTAVTMYQNAMSASASMATVAFNTLRTAVSRIVFPVVAISAFIELVERLGFASKASRDSFKSLVDTMDLQEIEAKIKSVNEEIDKLNTSKVKPKVDNSFSFGKLIDDTKQQFKDFENWANTADKKLATAIERMLGLKENETIKERDKRILEESKKILEDRKKQIEEDKKIRQELADKEIQSEIALKQKGALEAIDAARLRSLDESQKKLEQAKLNKQKVLQDIYESSLVDGKVVIHYDKFKKIHGIPIYTAEMARQAIEYADKEISDAQKEILKKAVSDVSKFDKEMKSIADQIDGLSFGTEFEKKFGEYKKKFSAEEFANAISSGEMQKIKEAYQTLFNAEKIKEFNDELDRLKIEDFTRNLSEADKYAYSLNSTFEKLGTTGNEALEKKNELIKQFAENQKNLQKDNYLANYGTVEERTAQRRLELERQFGKLKESEPELFKRIQEESEKQIALDETLYKEKLKGVNTWGEAYQAWLDKTQASQQSWGEQVVSVFDTMSNSMTSAMTDFLDITSDGFADFGKMAISILQEVYKEILKVMAVKPLVNSVMGIFSITPTSTVTAPSVATVPQSYSVWQGGIANGNGFSKFAYGYLAGGGYSSYDSLANDKIPALISKGEAVIPASSVNANRGLISALISGRGRKFANGYIDGGSGGGNVKIQIINESGTQMEVTKTSQTTDVEGMVIQAWISGISKNRYGSRDILSQGVR